MIKFILSSLVALSGVCNHLHAQVIPLPNAHAHNDYAHTRPLFDALANGFTSIEADIHLVNGELYVSHDAPQNPDTSTTLKALYLEPLRKRMAQNGGFVYPGYTSPVTLLIDIKTHADSTYNLLKQQVQSYQSMLYYSGNPGGRVQLVISGNRPATTVSAEKNPLVSIDGRPEDLAKDYPVAFMPLISENYHKVTPWNGQGTIPAKELAKLKKLANDVHAQGKKLRLWASPEGENAWQTLLQAGVDFINTDQLPELKAFLSKARPDGK